MSTAGQAVRIGSAERRQDVLGVIAEAGVDLLGGLSLG